MRLPTLGSVDIRVFSLVRRLASLAEEGARAIELCGRIVASPISSLDNNEDSDDEETSCLAECNASWSGNVEC